MSETALYRKYRPKNFEEVLGQDHIVKALRGSVENGTISHAYLFYGTRGTGKTSIARIFAREIGCGEMDLYEIDAASNRGIDDVRELREAVKTYPFESPYKVYIIDEVHMLTKEAFNALLKTLEEPPKHAVFILATTELHKLPDTVISRCQQFTFKKPSEEMLQNVAVEVARKEGYTLPPAAGDLIALLGDGSFRDTLGTLQKVLASVEGKKITVEEVAKLTGVPRNTLINDFLSALAKKDISKALAHIREASHENFDMMVLSKLIIKKLRASMLLRFAPDMAEVISRDFTEEDFNFLKKFPSETDLKLSAVLREFLEASEAIPRSFIPELPLELAVLRVIGEDMK